MTKKPKFHVVRITPEDLERRINGGEETFVAVLSTFLNSPDLLVLLEHK